MNIFVLFGITGDLAKKRIIPAFVNISKDSSQYNSFQFIGVGRKIEPIPEFKALPNNLYLSGDLSSELLYKQLESLLVKSINKAPKMKKLGLGSERINLICYSSLPPSLHMVVVERLTKTLKSVQRLNKNIKNILNIQILIEKPLGNNLVEAKDIIDKLGKIQEKGINIKYVDHYLAKEAFTDFEKLFFRQPNLLYKILDPRKVKEIKVVIYDRAGINGRGAFYDKIGALFDVGQSHLLQVLATCVCFIQSFAEHTSAKHNKREINKSSILKKLQIDGEPLFWQYKGYLNEKDVDPNSTTETFFQAKFRLKNDKNNISYIMSAGKALDMDKSGIEIHYSDLSPSIFIDFKIESKDAYQILFEKVLIYDAQSGFSANLSYFAKPDEIIESWRIAERLKKLKTRTNLIVYKKLHDIIG